MIKIEINDEEISAALSRAIGFLEDPLSLMSDLSEVMLAQVQDRFGAGVAPDGTPWARNSPVTLARKKDTRPLFGESKSLSTVFTPSHGPNFAEVGSVFVYAPMMQYGGSKAKFPHLWGDIPARPFLGFSEEGNDDIPATITEAITAALSGGHG